MRREEEREAYASETDEVREQEETAKLDEGLKRENACEKGSKGKASRVYRCVCRRAPRGNVN